MPAPQSYSRTQILLHWAVVGLVLFQILAHDGISRAWMQRMAGDIPNVPTPNVHVVAGWLIFVLMAWRLALRLRRGAPPPPEDEHPALQKAARWLHALFYVVLLAMPFGGSAAWFFGLPVAAQVHSYAYWVLLILIPVHTLAALAQHFWFRTDVLKRMLGMT